jgi:hypothetical protein
MTNKEEKPEARDKENDKMEKLLTTVLAFVSVSSAVSDNARIFL